jgi:hypothetical protein
MKSTCSKRRLSIEPDDLHRSNESRWQMLLGTGRVSAMISSTALDLPDHRPQVREACLCEGIFPIGMESLPARDADAIRVSLEMVDKADIYIGIFAWRYGHIPKGQEISITEMEFNRAVQRRIPVLVFVAHKEHPLTIGMVEATQGAQKKLRKLKERACKGRTRVQFSSPADLRAGVIQALSALKQRDLPANSPTDAIRTEKQRLERLDPRFSVDITATAQSMHVHLRPVEPILELPVMKFLTEGRTGEMKTFFEKGESFEVSASEIRADDWPIFDSLLRELGDAKVTITNAIEFRGCLQLAFRSSGGVLAQVQVDGEWALALKRAVFKGQLSDSPLCIECVRELDGAGVVQPGRIRCRFDWNAWKGQALLGLAYFSELSEWIRCSEFTVRSYIRGNQPWQPEVVRVVDPVRQKVIEAIDWLLKSRHAAEYLRVNPPFPLAETINAKEAESQDVQLMVKLIESGFHEQSNAGQTVGISAEESPDTFKIGTEGLNASLPEPFRKINFFGLEIPFGPLVHTWTDLQLVAVRPLAGNRQEMEFKGGAKSTWRIEYVRPSPPTPTNPAESEPHKP